MYLFSPWVRAPWTPVSGLYNVYHLDFGLQTQIPTGPGLPVMLAGGMDSQKRASSQLALSHQWSQEGPARFLEPKFHPHLTEKSRGKLHLRALFSITHQHPSHS